MQEFIRDRRLSYKARGILAFLFSSEDGWHVDVQELINASDKDGRTSVQSALQELVSKQYIRLEIVRDNYGRASGKQYVPVDKGVKQAPLIRKIAPPIMGYVYVIKGGEHCKIGCTRNIKQRLTPMGAQAPFPLQTLVLIASGDMVAVEAELHETFAAKRIRGEWFNLDEEDIDTIRRTYDITDPSGLIVK